MSDKPEVFGKYILLEKIASGGMAEIYLAKSIGAENVSKFLAIKRILPQFSQNYEFVEMFKEEAKIAIQLSHANIVPIFEFGEESRQFFLAMEYVEGRNLRQILNYFKKREAQLSIPMIVYIMKEAARGLDHAHRCVDGTTGAPLNIVHRDISPQNVMLSFEGEVKIVDFGIAKAESKIETTRAGTLKGKFGYMSPEQAEGQEVDFRTDIFSLGIVLWELLANDRLFVANNEMNTLRKIRDCQIPSLRKIDPNISTELERITNKALTRDRTLRYQSGEDMYKDLSIFINKQYPEFSGQDLAKLLKKVFQKEREENRKKLIEYSKLKMTGSGKDEKTDLVLEITNTQTEPSSPHRPVPTKTDAESTNPSLPSSPTSPAGSRTGSFSAKLTKTKPPEKLNLDFDRDDLVVKSSKQRVKATRPTAPANMTTYDNYPSANQTSTNSQPYATDIQFRPDPPSRFLTLLVLGALAFLGYKFYNSEYWPQAKAKYYVFVGKLGPDEDSGKEEIGSKGRKQDSKNETIPYYSLLVTSNPTGAAIYIDGKFQELYTPGQIRVPANTDFNIQLRKDGYATSVKDHRVSQPGDEYRVTLAPVKLGYLNVQIFGGVKSTVYINKIKVEAVDLLKKYPVQAGTPIVIQVYGADGNTYAEETVQPVPDAVTNIIIKLERRRAPANKR